MGSAEFRVIIEIPKGSRNKYEYDHETHAIKLDRFLFASVVYPTDYGFIPDTLSLDGDPLDVMVCVSEPTFPGCVIEVKPIALFRMEDDQGVDDKVLAVPCSDPTWNQLETLEDINQQMQDELRELTLSVLGKGLDLGIDAHLTPTMPRQRLLFQVEYTLVYL